MESKAITIFVCVLLPSFGAEKPESEEE